jgi:hypothetical protein
MAPMSGIAIDAVRERDDRRGQLAQGRLLR